MFDGGEGIGASSPGSKIVLGGSLKGILASLSGGGGKFEGRVFVGVDCSVGWGTGFGVGGGV